MASLGSPRGRLLLNHSQEKPSHQNERQDALVALEWKQPMRAEEKHGDDDEATDQQEPDRSSGQEQGWRSRLLERIVPAANGEIVAHDNKEQVPEVIGHRLIGVKKQRAPDRPEDQDSQQRSHTPTRQAE